MIITKGEFCGFTLHGRLRLLEQYGQLILEKIIERNKISIFKIFDFHVELIKDVFTKKLLKADPVSIEIVNYYRTELGNL